MVRKHIAGSYDSENEEIAVIEDLKRQGYNSDEISVVSRDTGDVAHVTEETDTNAVEGASTGAGVGWLAGALIVGMGIPDEEAQQYDERFNEGKILVFLDGNYEHPDL